MIKKRVIVTITKEFDIELTDKMFCKMSEEEYIKEFSKFLWKIDNINDVVKYAASVAANGGIGYQHDAIGLVDYYYNDFPEDNAKLDVIIGSCDEYTEVDIIGDSK